MPEQIRNELDLGAYKQAPTHTHTPTHIYKHNYRHLFRERARANALWLSKIYVDFVVYYVYTRCAMIVKYVCMYIE